MPDLYVGHNVRQIFCLVSPAFYMMAVSPSSANTFAPSFFSPQDHRLPLRQPLIYIQHDHHSIRIIDPPSHRLPLIPWHWHQNCHHWHMKICQQPPLTHQRFGSPTFTIFPISTTPPLRPPSSPSSETFSIKTVPPAASALKRRLRRQVCAYTLPFKITPTSCFYGSWTWISPKQLMDPPYQDYQLYISYPTLK